jgi:beta-glucosidase
MQYGQTATAELQLDEKSFEFFDENTNTICVRSGQYELLYGTNSLDKDLKKLNYTLNE